MDTRTRLVIYAILLGSITMLGGLRLLDVGQSDAIMAVCNAALDLVSAGMLIVASRRVTPDSWSAFRRPLYALMAAALVAAAALGFAAPADWLPQASGVLDGLEIVVLGIAAYKTPYEAQHLAD